MNIYQSIFLALLIGGSNVANSDSISEKLSALLRPIESMSANFTQQLFDADDSELELFEGVFKLAKPGKMLWHIKQPMEQKLVSDGEVLWIYDPDLEQVVIESFADKIKSTPIALFNGQVADLDSRYTITQQHTERSTEIFTLSPKDTSSLFSRIDITFVDSVPQSIAVIDTFEQRTLIVFDKLSVNPLFDPSIFSFIIPNQVDVINNVR
ncbi:MAG: outer membrane lipoprotein carrier protein [Porticoccaceae bacterium]|jgi:outer membrane lipoprotein carrier protein|tara:strand:- start:7827 stop:8456 length:630 start_codon:yes stop_codon:yes gene_type:complete